jgi:hypothetical protein
MQETDAINQLPNHFSPNLDETTRSLALTEGWILGLP